MSKKKAEVAKAAARNHRRRAAELKFVDPAKAAWHERQADLLTKRAIQEMKDPD